MPWHGSLEQSQVRVGRRALQDSGDDQSQGLVPFLTQNRSLRFVCPLFSCYLLLVIPKNFKLFGRCVNPITP